MTSAFNLAAIRPGANILGRYTGALYAPATTRLLAGMQAAGASPPTTAHRRILDDFMEAVAAPAAKLDGLWILAGHDRAAGRVNAVAPGRFNLTEGDSANLTFTAFEGFTGNGTTSFLRVDGYNPTVTTGIKFSTNDASLFVYSLTDLDNAGADIGSGILTRVISRLGGFLTTRANSGSTGSAVVADSLGLIGWSRDAADHYDIFRGNSIVGSPVVASSGASSADARVGAAGTSYSSRKLAFAGIGGALTAQDISDLNTACTAYLAAVA